MIMKVLCCFLFLIGWLVSEQSFAQKKPSADTMFVVGYELSRGIPNFINDNKYFVESFVKIPIAKKFKVKIAGGVSQYYWKEKDGIFDRRTKGWFAKFGFAKNIIAKEKHTSNISLTYFVSKYEDTGEIRVEENNGIWPAYRTPVSKEGFRYGFEGKAGCEIKIVKGLHMGLDFRLNLPRTSHPYLEPEDFKVTNRIVRGVYIPGIGRAFIGGAMTVLYKFR